MKIKEEKIYLYPLEESSEESRRIIEQLNNIINSSSTAGVTV